MDMVTSSTQTSPQIWKLIFLSSLIPFFIVFPEPALPQLSHFFADSLTITQWIIATCSLAYGIGALLYAPIANHFGLVVALRYFMSFGLVGSIVCVIGYVLKLLILMFIGRAILGIGVGSGLVISMILMQKSYPPKTARILYSCVVPFFMFAPALSLTCAGLVIGHLGVFSIFIIICILNFVGCLVTFTISKLPHDSVEPLNLIKVFFQYGSELRSLYFIQLLIILAVAMSSIYIFNTISTLVAENILHESSETYGFLICIPSSGLFIGALMSVILNQYFHQAWVIRVGMIIAILSAATLFGLLLFSFSVWELVLPAIGIFTAASMVIANASMYLLQISKNSAIASSLFSSFGLILASITLPIMTHFLVHGAIVLPIALMSLIFLAVLLSFLPMK